jgi:hypothetical protein
MLSKRGVKRRANLLGLKPKRKRKKRTTKALTAAHPHAGPARGQTQIGLVKGARVAASARFSKVAITLSPELAVDVRQAAERTSGGNVSAWIAEAARQRLRLEALDEAIAAYEGRHGVITEEEVAHAERELWPRQG